MESKSAIAGCSCEVPRLQVRRGAVGRALSLEYLTVAWNVFEGVTALTAALLAGSVAILGFGLDSFVECGSALVLVWRLRAERDQRLNPRRFDEVERRARRLAGGSLLLLSGCVTVDAMSALWNLDCPAFSPLGVGLFGVSAVVMLWLARRKRGLARELGSEAMDADAFQSTACSWLSLSGLVGVGLNGLFGWWWADPLAALLIAVLIAREGREAWNGRGCCGAELR